VTIVVRVVTVAGVIIAGPCLVSLTVIVVNGTRVSISSRYASGSLVMISALDSPTDVGSGVKSSVWSSSNGLIMAEGTWDGLSVCRLVVVELLSAPTAVSVDDPIPDEVWLSVDP
jgi:hypothetical protein